MSGSRVKIGVLLQKLRHFPLYHTQRDNRMFKDLGCKGPSSDLWGGLYSAEAKYSIRSHPQKMHLAVIHETCTYWEKPFFLRKIRIDSYLLIPYTAQKENRNVMSALAKIPSFQNNKLKARDRSCIISLHVKESLV